MSRKQGKRGGAKMARGGPRMSWRRSYLLFNVMFPPSTWDPFPLYSRDKASLNKESVRGTWVQKERREGWRKELGRDVYGTLPKGMWVVEIIDPHSNLREFPSLCGYFQVYVRESVRCGGSAWGWGVGECVWNKLPMGTWMGRGKMYRWERVPTFQLKWISN